MPTQNDQSLGILERKAWVPTLPRHAVGKADFHLKGRWLEETLQAFLVKSRKVLT